MKMQSTADTFAADTSEWVFDFVINLFHSPEWEVPLMCFIDENCAVFDTSEENKLVYTELFQQYREIRKTRKSILISLTEFHV